MRLLFAVAVAAPASVSPQCQQLLLAPASVCFVYHCGEIKRQPSDFPVQRQRPHPALDTPLHVWAAVTPERRLAAHPAQFICAADLGLSALASGNPAGKFSLAG